MIEVKVRNADACTVKSETMTRGRVGAMIHFNFSEEWEGLDRVAVFSNGVTDIDVYLESDTVPVPPEMFREAGRSVKVGVRGDHIEGDVVTVVIPTVYTLLGTVFNGTDISGNAPADITPSLADQIMAAAQNAVDTANSVREDADAGVFDGVDGFSPTVAVTDIDGGHRVTIADEDGEHVFDVMDGQGGGGGTGDHNQLTNRDAANQHPMSAITGLQTALDGKITSEQLPSAINAALEQAKESGEFDGADGADGEPGQIGPRGPSGVYIGDTEPTDADVWIYPDGEVGIPATQDWVEQQIYTQTDDYYPWWNSVKIANGFAIATANIGFDASFISNKNGISHTESIYVRLPYPMKEPALTGSSDYGGHVITAVEGIAALPTETKNDTAEMKFNVYSLRGESVGAQLQDYFRLSVTGEIATLPAEPRFEADATMGQQAQSIAQSYVDAAISGRVFVYGRNWLYSKSHNLNDYSTRVEDGNGNYIFGGRMECDTFVQMILHGIPYSLSPYADTTAETFDYEDLAEMDNPNNYPWVAYLLDNIKDNPCIKHTTDTGIDKDVRFAAEIAWIMWTMDAKACLFTDCDQARAGDIAFFKTDGKSVFDNISHVAFVGEENGEKYIYEVSTEKVSHPNAVYKTKLSEYTRTPAYFARINLSAEEASE